MNDEVDDIEEFSETSEGTAGDNSQGRDMPNNDNPQSNRSASGKGNNNGQGDKEGEGQDTGDKEGGDKQDGDKEGDGQQGGDKEKGEKEGDGKKGGKEGKGDKKDTDAPDGGAEGDKEGSEQKGEGKGGKDGNGEKGDKKDDNAPDGGAGDDNEGNEQDGEGKDTKDKPEGQESDKEGDKQSDGDGDKKEGDDKEDQDKKGTGQGQGDNQEDNDGQSDEEKEKQKKEEEESDKQDIYYCQSLVLFKKIVKRDFTAVDLEPEYHLFSQPIRNALVKIGQVAKNDLSVDLEFNEQIPELDVATTKAMLLQIKNNVKYFSKSQPNDYSHIHLYIYDFIKSSIIDLEANEQFESFSMQYQDEENDIGRNFFITEINKTSKRFNHSLMLVTDNIEFYTSNGVKKFIVDVSTTFKKAEMGYSTHFGVEKRDASMLNRFLTFMDIFKENEPEINNSSKEKYLTHFKNFVNFVLE